MRYYKNKAQTLGTAATMMIEHAETGEAPTDAHVEDLESIDTFLASFDVLEEEDNAEFDTWICELLDTIDSISEPQFNPTHSFHELHVGRDSRSRQRNECYAHLKRAHALPC